MGTSGGLLLIRPYGAAWHQDGAMMDAHDEDLAAGLDVDPSKLSV